MANEKKSTVDTTKKEKDTKKGKNTESQNKKKTTSVKVENKKTKDNKTKQEKETKKSSVKKEQKESVSIQEIKETIDQKENFPKEEEAKVNRHIFYNILVAISIITYFIFLNLGQMHIEQQVYVTDLKVFGMCILLLAICLIENAYKKDNGSIALYGIEMIVLALITVSLIYVKLMLSTRYGFIVTAISYIFASYYLIKSVIIYVRKRKRYFVDKMKEIINDKEE